MFFKIDTPKRRGAVLLWLREQGESGAYEMSRGAKVWVGFLYPLLTILEREGLVGRRWTDHEPRRVMYALTEHGRDVATRYARG